MKKPFAYVFLSFVYYDEYRNLQLYLKNFEKRKNRLISGPIYLPLIKKKIRIRRAPGGDGKASYETYQMQIYRIKYYFYEGITLLKVLDMFSKLKHINTEINIL